VKIAVAQHRSRPAPAQDLEALVVAATEAVRRGAHVLVLPALPALQDGPLGEELWRRLDETAPELAVLMPAPAVGHVGTSQVREVQPLGRVAFISGDAVVDGAALSAAATESPDVAVLSPQSESELQAEALLELAIGLSASLAAVVIVAETDGAEVGEPGHGGTAVLHLGEVLAEAMSGDDLLVVEIETPVGSPESLGPLPQIPPLLGQRLAAHRGQKLNVDYPADLD